MSELITTHQTSWFVFSHHLTVSSNELFIYLR
nr:MAG TPA: hypothetical protein [Caudoviricetes sp.]